MSAFPTAVTVVTALGQDGPSGATANSVTSLSLEPPMMLACLDRGSRTLASVRAAGTFAVNVLAADQAELARRFSSKDAEPSKWEGVEWTDRQGSPKIARTLVWLRCELRDLIDGGDHLIVTGSVLEVETEERGPLLFYGGRYRGLGG
jgi:flavin reductase (DIM6/NTAB) family NADH-FMN oxidoreductase RutF